MKENLEKTQVNSRQLSMDDTQPSVRVKAEFDDTPSSRKISMKHPLLYLIGICLVAMIGVFVLSGTLGRYQGRQSYAFQATSTSFAYMENQLSLAINDIQNEDYSIALQRLNYIYENDPVQFAAAGDLINQVNTILNLGKTPLPATATPTQTMTPTLDLRPADDQFQNAQQAMAAQNWEQVLEICLNLRKSNPSYKVTEIDQMVYVALRFLGIQKIVDDGMFESGIYDFALAEQYGVLDFYSVNLRTWANYYLLGNSFWLAYPEIAASYYGQVSAAMPHLTDEAGYTAFYRYWMSLIHIADQLVDDEEWCEGSAAYTTALNAAGSAEFAPTATYVWEQCAALTPTMTPTPTFTMTPTLTATIDLTSIVSPTLTPTLGAPSETPTMGVPATETPTSAAATPTFTNVPVNTDTPVPVDTDTPVPVDTDTPVPIDTDTPIPVDTDTPVPSGVKFEDSLRTLSFVDIVDDDLIVLKLTQLLSFEGGI